MTKTLAIDFDGVLHSYTSPWEGPACIPDPPVFGAKEFLTEGMKVFDRVIIFSTRAKTKAGQDAIVVWLVKHGLPVPFNGHEPAITAEKPLAHVYLDDRGWRFRGVWPDLTELFDSESWVKK